MDKSFLLGAGASVDAGLPTSMQLTARIAEQVEETRGPSAPVSALHMVIGAMVQHDTANGARAFDGVDVERVFSAVKSLKDRDSIDLSAFVELWNPRLSNIGNPSPRFPAFWTDGFRRAADSERFAPGLEQWFTEGVQAVQGARQDEVFGELETLMLRALIDLLGVEPNGVGYLEPMLRATDLVAIASLNYDLAVETAGDNFGLDVDTGLSNWTGGYEWSWRSDADVRLLKLHGSIDYVLASHQATSDRMAGDRLDRTDSDDDNRPQFGSPAMVFGQGSKLRSDGPFLAMLVELDRILERTEWLTIIGYSFRDDHINAALTRWVNGSLAERLTIIDPSIGKWDTSERTAPTYLRHLLDAARGCTREEAGKWGLTWPELWLDLEPSGAKCGLVQFDFDS